MATLTPPTADTLHIVNEQDETFLTQRAGKIVETHQHVHDDVPPPVHNKKKEMGNIQMLLEKKRVEFKKRLEECREKQEELRTKQKQIKDRVLKFEKFLKENDAKRQRANLKAQTERKIREQKELELQILQQQLHELQAKSDRIRKQLKKFKVFEDYLSSVVSIMPMDYLDVNEPHINDILMRFKTLNETNIDLKRTAHQNAENVEKETTHLNSLVKARNDLVLVSNSSLGTLQKRLDKLKAENAHLVQKLDERSLSGRTKRRMLAEIKLAIDNLYSRVSVTTVVSFKDTVPNMIITNTDASKPTTGVDRVKPGISETQGNQQQTQPAKKIVPVSEKLQLIENRVMDLGLVVEKASQIITKQQLQQQQQQQQQNNGSIHPTSVPTTSGLSGLASRSTIQSSRTTTGFDGSRTGNQFIGSVSSVRTRRDGESRGDF